MEYIIDNSFGGQISFQEMKLAFGIFESVTNSGGDLDDMEEILVTKTPFCESDLLAQTTLMRLNALVSIIVDPKLEKYINRIIDSNGDEALDVSDPFLFACANASLDDDMDFSIEEILEIAETFSPEST